MKNKNLRIVALAVGCGTVLLSPAFGQRGRSRAISTVEMLVTKPTPKNNGYGLAPRCFRFHPFPSMFRFRPKSCAFVSLRWFPFHQRTTPPTTTINKWWCAENYQSVKPILVLLCDGMNSFAIGRSAVCASHKMPYQQA